MFLKTVKILNYAEEVLLAYCFSGLGILIVFDSLGRKFGIFSIFWLEEFGRYILIFMAFIAAGKAVKDDRHINMGTVVGLFPIQIIHVIKGITNLLCFLFFLYMDYFAWLHVIHLYRIGARTSTLGVPFYIPYLPIPIFFVCIFVRYLIASVKEFQTFLKSENVPMAAR